MQTKEIDVWVNPEYLENIERKIDITDIEEYGLRDNWIKGTLSVGLEKDPKAVISLSEFKEIYESCRIGDHKQQMDSTLLIDKLFNKDKI